MKATAEREVTATMEIKPAAGILTDRSTTSTPFLFKKGLTEDHDGLDFLFFLYAELLCQISGLYASIPQELRGIRG